MESFEQFVDKHKNEKVIIMDRTFTLIDGILYFSERKVSHLRLRIPKDMIDEVLWHNHDLIGHPDIAPELHPPR